MLERLFRSKAEVAVLKIVLFFDGLHLREIARRAGISSYEAKRELDNLVDLGILESEKRGNQVIFHANEKCSFLRDLRNLFSKTEGAIARLKEKLGAIEGLEYCLIFGSAAQGRLSETSDIDILIISDLPEDRIDEDVLNIQKGIKREINHILWTGNDFKKKLKGRSSFLRNISLKGFIWIKGDEDGFVRAVEEAYGGEGS
jgi:predicted nucleotidyltransferase